MEYDKQGNPVTKVKRVHRRRRETKAVDAREEQHRKRLATGKSDNAGATEGQNAEQGNAERPEFTQDIGRRT